MVSSAACAPRSTPAVSSAPQQRSASAVPLATMQLAIALPARVGSSPMEPFAAPANRSVPTALLAQMRELAEHAPLATTAILAKCAITITLSQPAVPSPALPAAPRETTASNARTQRARSALSDTPCPPAPPVLSAIPVLDALTVIVDFSETTPSAAPARQPSILAATCATTGSPARSAPPGTMLPSIAPSALTDFSTRPPMAIPLSAPPAPRTAPHAHQPPHALPANLDSMGPFAGDVHPVTPLHLATNATLITFPQEEECAVPVQAPMESTAASAPTDPFAKRARSDGKAPNAMSALLATTAIVAMAASQHTTRREQSASPAPKSTRTASPATQSTIALHVLSASQGHSARNAPPDTSIIAQCALLRTFKPPRVPAFPAGLGAFSVMMPIPASPARLAMPLLSATPAPAGSTNHPPVHRLSALPATKITPTVSSAPLPPSAHPAPSDMPYPLAIFVPQDTLELDALSVRLVISEMAAIAANAALPSLPTAAPATSVQCVLTAIPAMFFQLIVPHAKLDSTTQPPLLTTRSTAPHAPRWASAAQNAPIP